MAIVLALVVFWSGTLVGETMDLLMGLGGMAGAAFLLAPAPALPSETDYKKALDKLQTTPDDPDANTVVGKYLAFVQGDYEQGMTYLVKSGDKTLRTLAEHERAPLYADTGPKKVGMADEWVNAAKSNRPLFRIFYDRAAYWLGQAWPEMKEQPLWGDKIRERLQKIYTVVPGQAAPTKLALPAPWKSPYADTKGARTAAAFRSGASSFQISGWKSPLPAYTALGQNVDVKPGTYKFSAWVITDGTDDDDGFLIAVQNAAGKNLILKPLIVPKDQPWWRKFSMDIEVPADGSRISLAYNVGSKQGQTFLDDWSLKGPDGKELLKNGSFEDK